MGFLKSVGKAGLELGKDIGKGVGATANFAGKRIVSYGDGIIKNSIANPIKTAAAIGAVGAAGYIAGDLDRQSNPSATAGKAALGAAALTGIPGAITAGTALGAGVLGGATAVGGLALGLGNMSLKVPNKNVSFSNIGDIKFSTLGKTLITGSAIYEGVGRAANKFVSGRMGTNDGMMRTQTPIIPQNASSPSYANNGGATGDLVFSMYNNR